MLAAPVLISWERSRVVLVWNLKILCDIKTALLAKVSLLMGSHGEKRTMISTVCLSYKLYRAPVRCQTLEMSGVLGRTYPAEDLSRLSRAVTWTPDSWPYLAFAWYMPSPVLGTEKVSETLALLLLGSLPLPKCSDVCGSAPYLCFSFPSSLAWWCYQAPGPLSRCRPFLKGTTAKCFVQTWCFPLFRRLQIIHINDRVCWVNCSITEQK